VRSLLLVTAVLSLVSMARAGELELLQTIPLKGKPGNLDHLALDAKRGRLLVANKANDTLDVVDLKSGTLLKQVPNQTGVQGIAYAADVDRVYAGLASNGLCNVLDGETYKALKTIKFADDADNVRYDPRSKLVYVAHAEKSLGVISARTNVVKAEIMLPASAESFQIESKRPLIYVAAPSPCQLIVVDATKNEVIAAHPIKSAGAAHPLALDEANHRAYVGCRKEPMVVALDTESGKELGTVAIPGDVDDLFLDAANKKLYASCGEGFLAVVKADGDKLELIEKVPTLKGARTCLYVPETRRLYLAVPRQEGKEGPEIQVYQAK
jgi:DNA-binding beta-propeller fold protein YncE